MRPNSETIPQRSGTASGWLSRTRRKRWIGSAGFQGKPDDQGSIEIGFGVHPDFRNAGYATEAVNALLSWARLQTDVRAVIAHCDPSNPASIRVLEKAGMRTTEGRDNLLAWSTEPV
jgi:[ribosomal protein S5]-alanine N-acetyltransferase